MTLLLNAACLCVCVLLVFAAAAPGIFVGRPLNGTLQSLAEKETVLPCRYQPGEGNLIVQVTWFKASEMIITATNDATNQHSSGQTATFGTWASRVRFHSSKPTEDSSLVLLSTEVSDEGLYTCRVSTYPTGNFEDQMSLVVWTVPISSLDSVVLEEGQSYQTVATCRSIARPPPRLTWDTELNGQVTERSFDTGAVSSYYALHPLGSQNGKRLDCLVWHPSLSSPRRYTNTLVVHFPPPHAAVSGYDGNWYVGLENAALRCVAGGNPKPQNFTWTRAGGKLPEGVIPHPNGTLLFGRPLSLSDNGIYQCVAKNKMGTATAEVEVFVKVVDPLLLIICGAAGGLLILMLIAIVVVTRHHKRKNKRLERELNEKREEISTLSRQASFRRVNSVSTDARGTADENMPLKMEGTMRTSTSTLGEQANCRDSRSTISGGRTYDYLGRPAVHTQSRRGRDRVIDRDDDNKLRVETFVRDTTLSLDNCFHPPLVPSMYPMKHSTEYVRHLNGSSVIPADGTSRQGSITRNHPHHHPLSCTYPPATDDEDEVDEGLGGPASQEHPDDQDSETNNSHVSEAHSAIYQQTNGSLRAKSRLSPIPFSPHATLIHKAQIV
ncbi:nectin-4 isoform X2 [Betta splendens]|uniref:Nectin-4 isoform X2 n=1 Tax=Betta splendens TaxID=158456 RepID=A0A9W2XND1_BETSP|nr:nectin-4 isoform X2 [Betta splendens]